MPFFILAQVCFIPVTTAFAWFGLVTFDFTILAGE